MAVWSRKHYDGGVGYACVIMVSKLVQTFVAQTSQWFDFGGCCWCQIGVNVAPAELD